MTRSLALLLLLGCSAGPDWRSPPAPDAPELVGVWYTVEAGDTVSAIAERNKVPSEDIVELNGLVDPDRLQPGQPLFLYGIEEVLRRKAKPVPPVSTPEKPRGKAPKFAWPLRKGVISSGFGKRGRRMHKGLDIAAEPGTPILAAADGTVLYSDDKQRGYGNLVILEHAHGYVTVYAHNRRNLVDEGETVRQGAPIAEVGSTGRSTGPHLHFEIRRKNKAMDPLVHLPAR